jgi:competence protein CoiA
VQLFAKGLNESCISAEEALKGVDYSCIECNSIVRLRGGSKKQLHFFHLQAQQACSLHGKSMEHLQTQLYFQKMIGEENCFLEFPRKEIGRIADILWEKEKIVFEVQCSYILAEEIAQRNRDWLLLGYRVVWILHLRRYGKTKQSEAEKYLEGKPHYYTDMDQNQLGDVFDQEFFYLKGYLLHKTAPSKIEVASIFRDKKSAFRPLWPFYFKGDFIDTNYTPPFIERMKKKNIYDLIKKKYIFLLDILLKNTLGF